MHHVWKLIVVLALVAWIDQSVAAPRAEIDPMSALVAVAGRYYHGDGLGVNCALTIEPVGRFSFNWDGCLGLYDQNVGGARVDAGHLILSPLKSNRREGFSGTPTDFHIVAWGERRYLIPEAQKSEFCNAVNTGFEPRTRPHGRYYLRREDWGKQVNGAPEVPLEWRPLLLKAPLHGQVIEVLANGRAKIDFGATQGVWKGLELWLDTSGFGLAEVVEVGEKSCIISIKYSNSKQNELRLGQGVKSRLRAGS